MLFSEQARVVICQIDSMTLAKSSKETPEAQLQGVFLHAEKITLSN